MAEKTQNETEEPAKKRIKTSDDKCERQGSSAFRDMLSEVGEIMTSEHVEKLANLADFSIREKDDISRYRGNKALRLFDLLEEKGKLKENDVLWLHSNLVKIHNKMAAEIVHRYMSGADEIVDFPSEPESSSSEDNDECNYFHEFLSKLGTQDNFPGKLTLKMFLKVKDLPEKQDYIESFWQKLTSLDYRAGFPDYLLSNRFSMRDFIFSILHCSDDFARQDILEKMSACQLAVPVVLKGIDSVPTTFLLWALRRITKKWKGPRDPLAIEQPIVSYPLFIVSVLRIGNVRESKSEVLNTMLSESQGYSLHSYFLTKGRDIKPKFSEGSVECGWFLPMHGNDKEIFKEVMVFFNLRGDCTRYPSQRKFACRSSNLTIAFIATNKRDENVNVIREIKGNSRNCLFVAVKENDSGKRSSQKVPQPIFKDGWLFVKVLQTKVLSKKICDAITKVCDSEDRTSFKSLEGLQELAKEMMQVDECTNDCARAQQLVLDFFKPINTDDILNFKKTSFPLQAVWKDLVNIEKGSYDTNNEEQQSFEHQKEHKLSEIRSKRESQLKISFSETMTNYYHMVTSGKDNSSLLQYILGFLQEKIFHMVNGNTKGDLNKILELEQLLRKRQGSESNIKESENTSNASKEREERANVNYQDRIKECNELHITCREKFLGCEHFLRELGQLYEAFKDVKHSAHTKTLKKFDTITLLPELAAHLVNEMHSLEILDGDTGSVPLTWVTSVLDSLTQKLSNPKVLVLSVIGVQSSGKSTFLNSMFGVRFPVRAGRCTRGLFIRFLQIEEKLAQELGCEYLIVVDTEGIRSLDHDDRRFDNELVTLALSISSVTIFNIEGENIGPDMTGILQIAAHALMRMKEVDLECHCRIVQQRVSDLTAGDRNKANTNRIMETLDQATKIAAEEEGLEGRYQFFADVVDLRVDESLQYIPCLWTGGMSPPNHMYSETVGKVKSQLFKDIREENIAPNFTLSTFTQRIIDAWKAVKEEDFVFNFQDSVKAVDFNKFCLEYNKWIAEMRGKMALHTDELLQQIDNEMSDGGRETENFEELDIEKLKQDLTNRVEEVKKELNESVKVYIANHVRTKTIQRYKKVFLDEISIALRDVENHAIATLTDEYELQKLKLTKNLQNFKAEWRRRLCFEAKKAADSVTIDNTTSYTHSLRLFEIHWDKWKEMINKECKINKIQMTPSSLQIVCEKLLLRITRDMDVGSEVRKLMSVEGGIDKHGYFPSDCSKYIHTKFVKAWIRHRLLSMKENYGNINKQTEEQLIENEREAAVAHVRSIIFSESRYMMAKQDGKPFDGNIYQLMLQNTLDKLSEKQGNFKPPQALIAKGLLCTAGSSLNFLFGNEVENGNNFSELLHAEKEATCKDFIVFCRGDNHAVRAAEFLYYYIEPTAVKTFKKKIREKQYQRSISHTLTWEVPWDVLSYIAETFSSSMFDLFENLFFTPLKASYLHLAEKYTSRRSDQLSRELENKVNTFILEMIQVVDRCERERCTLNELSSRLVSNLEGCSIADVEELFEVNDITVVCTQLRQEFNNTLSDKLNHELYPVFETLLRVIFRPYNVIICSKVCPMCDAPCTNPLSFHESHFSHLHRPRGFKGATYSDTKKLVIEDCSSAVMSKSSTFKYRTHTYLCHQYKDVCPDWNIRPSRDDPGKIFWQWLFVMFNHYMASLYECNPADIPQSWFNITKEDALNSLEEDKRLKMEGRI